MPRLSRLAVLLALSLLATVGVAAQVAPEGPEPTESERLYAWFDQAFFEELARSPQAQTALGMIDDLEAYGRWDDFSEAAARERHARGQRRLAEMRERFDYDALTEDARLSFRFFEFQQDMADRLFGVRESAYVFSPMQDAVSGVTTFLINNHRVSQPAHAEAYVSRLEGIGPVMDELVMQAQARAEAGVLLPLFAYPRLITAARAQLAGAPFAAGAEDGVLLADLRAKLTALGLSDGQEADLLRRAETALTDVYQPAVERYIAALQAMERSADERAGAWKLPGGEAFYEAQVYLFTTRHDLTAAEIHQIGLDNVERIRAEMHGIMDQVGFEGSLQDFFEFVRTDPQFYYPNTEEGRQAYLDESTRMIEQVMEAAPRFFNVLPEAGLEVRRVEAFREATAPFAFYDRPSLDGSRPGYYYVNLADMANAPIYLMESLAYHEGAPGHHFQLALAQELQGLPFFQRLAVYSAYVEGWALYAERLGKDMGFFTDPYKDFGRLSYEIFRAARLVVDTGIHDQRWTREQAIDYMLANTPMTEADIAPEVERYIVWPGQALSYMIGMNTILDLRERAMDALGQDFDWGGFHDAVLTAGGLPLTLLEERVDAWIANVRARR
jgi:uncharacterized protein (DUF885 family)